MECSSLRLRHEDQAKEKLKHDRTCTEEEESVNSNLLDDHWGQFQRQKRRKTLKEHDHGIAQIARVSRKQFALKQKFCLWFYILIAHSMCNYIKL